MLQRGRSESYTERSPSLHLPLKVCGHAFYSDKIIVIICADPSFASPSNHRRHLSSTFVHQFADHYRHHRVHCHSASFSIIIDFQTSHCSPALHSHPHHPNLSTVLIMIVILSTPTVMSIILHHFTSIVLDQLFKLTALAYPTGNQVAVGLPSHMLLRMGSGVYGSTMTGVSRGGSCCICRLKVDGKAERWTPLKGQQLLVKPAAEEDQLLSECRNPVEIT